MLHSRIYLVGMPASGKTTLGRHLAELLGYACVDLDKWIETRENATVAEIFAKKGETYFRQTEQQALHASFEWEKKVIATGGGTPCFFDNMKQIKEHGFAIFLAVSPAELLVRIRRQTHISRPLFQAQTDADLLNQLQEKLQQRIGYYKEANMMVSAENQNARELAISLTNFFQHWQNEL
jgi:shikimate kinase